MVMSGLIAQAGAGGVASMAAAPFPLDLSAPAFGASMAAAAGSFAAFSGEGGWDVPSGARAGGIDGRGGIMGIVHPGEMILPRDLADSVRGRAANSNQAPAPSGDGGSFTINLNGAVSPS